MRRVPLVEMTNVHVTRGGHRALRGVDLRIDEGERLAIIGPNGSGKSSLIKVMTGEWWHDTSEPGGCVRIMGSDSWNVFDVRRAFGTVSVELQHHLARGITSLEAVVSGEFGTIGTNRSQSLGDLHDARAAAALKLVGSSHLAARSVDSLSAGEARRVLMARALVNDPTALVLDEPMTSLDLMGKALVMEAMRELAHAGKSLVLVTHDPSDIPPEVDRVVMMKQGRIFMDSDIGSMNDESLSALFEVPIHLRKVDGRYLAWS